MANSPARRPAGRLALLMGISVSALHPSASLRAAQAPASSIAETAELRIAEIRLRERQVVLSDVIVYQTADQALLVPLAPLMEAIDFRIGATGDGGISGWFLRETQKLVADPATGKVKVAGRELALLPGDLAEINGELHVSTAALDRWLAMGVRWDAAAQILSLAPPYLLPAEELAARQRGAGFAGSGPSAIDTTGFVPVAAPWSPLGWPLVNLNMAAAYDDRAGGITVQANALAEGDLLWATGRLALTGSSQGELDARLTLARQDPQGRLLGGLGVTIIEAGDIAVPANPLLQRNAFGVGVRVGREPLGAVGEFDRSDLIGDAPPGWQAELYRDSELLGFQTIASDGRYFFPQVPVLFGVNRFRIVLYGPAGERQEISRTVDIGANLVRPGELRYNLVAMKQGYSLFGGPLDLNPVVTGNPADPEANASLFGFQQAATYLEARSAYGVARDLGVSGFAAWRRVDGAGPSLGYVGAGAITRVGGILAALDAIAQQDGATATRASLTAGLGSFSFTATHDRFDDGFFSEETGPERGGIAQRTQAGLNGRLGSLGLGLGAAATQLRSGGGDRNINLRANAAIAGFSISNAVFWRAFRSQAGEDANTRLDGQFALSGSIGPVRLRGGLDYLIAPDPAVRRLRGEVSSRLEDWFLALVADRDLENGGGQWGMVATRDWNGVRIGGDVRYEDQRGEWRGLMTLSLTLDRDPLGEGVRLGRDAISQRGSLLASGFRDANANGTRDPGEDALADLDFRIDPRGRQRRGAGPVLVEELPPDQPVALAPVIDGIDDPFLVPAVPGYLVTSRAGRPVRIDIPLIESGEVVAKLAGSAQQEDRSGVLVELADCATGQVARRERTAFDGLAFFSAVLPGCYVLRAEGKEQRVQVIGGDVIRADLP
ncbi:hypothetical protein [Porphyrobacter sp. AAP60]|uniref:hypothetical protein n=1 Tax=Porphyrobacter sp. AAP60 TaxID=1523423 RepID=UPI0006B915B6|nr:hypothetical protein [Porphyrobacter sp. AAP60]KPF62436.1 hypothetical protein IP79_12665 [Porphyrobacter sp. AAP60]